MSSSKTSSITILGSTGSIGTQALDVIARNNSQFKVEALAANCDVNQLYQQCLRHTPRYAVMANLAAAHQLEKKLKNVGSKTEVLGGAEALIEIARDKGSDIVIAAIVGAAGLLPTLAAVEAGKRILLANKELLVMAGKIFSDAIKKYHATLLPVDSEHNAILQCLSKDFLPIIDTPAFVRSIVLTASGGPFLNTPTESLARVTPELAIAHPNWSMGAKISVDSATMMNKGFEVIEAYWLFNLKSQQIEVILHPQSVVHALVKMMDGSVLVHMGQHDMRIPIASALAWPIRIESGAQELNLQHLGHLNFMPMDFEKFPALQLSYAALETGGTATVVLNAANEIAVDLFLNRKIPFIAIVEIVENVLSKINIHTAHHLDEIIAADQEARQLALHLSNNFRIAGAKINCGLS